MNIQQIVNLSIFFYPTDDEDDNDGIPDIYEDEDGNSMLDYLEGKDSDGDGIPDYLDDDDDNDGIPDVRDHDDDGDGMINSISYTRVRLMFRRTVSLLLFTQLQISGLSFPN